MERIEIVAVALVIALSLAFVGAAIIGLIEYIRYKKGSR